MPDFEQRMQIEMPSPSKLFTPAVTVLLVLMIVGYALIAYAPSLAVSMMLDPGAILHGKVWQLVSYVFFEGCSINLMFNGMTVLFIGSLVEREWKTRSLVALWLVTSVACGLIWTAVNLLAGKNGIGLGAGPCTYALIAAFGMLFRGRRFFFFVATVQAQTLAMIFIAIGLVLSISRPISAVWVGGALVGYLYIQLAWRLQFGFRLGGGGSGNSSRGRFIDID